MATILSQVPLTETADVLLVATAQGAGPAGWRVTFLGASWTGSVVLKTNRAAPGQAQSLTSIAYLTASTGATNAADTAITGDGDFIIPLASCAYDLYAVYTHTSGSCAVKVLTEDAGSGGGGGDVTAAGVDGSASQNTFGADIPYTGSYTFPGALAITGALTGVTQATFSTKVVSSTALATPSALAATALNAFASTVSGAVLMGYGTTGDVTLKNRAGTSVAYVGPNTTKFWCVGDLAIAGAFTGATTGSFSSTLASGAITAPSLTALATPADVGTTPATAAPTQVLATNTGGATTIVTTGVGGKGGDASVTTGAGGTAALAATAGTGGAGGDYAVTTGAGAVSAVTGAGTGTGGKGGALAFTSGVGGAASTSTGVNLGGASGAITLTTSAGGAATNGSANTGGASGVVTIATGNGGAGATAQGVSGAITLQTGTSTATVGAIICSPGGVQLLNLTNTGATTGLVLIDGTYGAGVASLRLNGLTNAAGGNTGTLTNCPHTGNPSFWAPVSIAGTVYAVPCFALT